MLAYKLSGQGLFYYMLRHCLDQWGPELVFPSPFCQQHFHPTSAILTTGFEEFGVTKSNEFTQLKANLTFKKKIKLWIWETNDGSLSHSPLPTISCFLSRRLCPEAQYLAQRLIKIPSLSWTFLMLLLRYSFPWKEFICFALSFLLFFCF